MTSIALLPPPLERLFDRIDAAEPSDPYLRSLLEIWRTQRLERFLPTQSHMAGIVPGPIAVHSFAFQRTGAPTNDWQLMEAGDSAGAIIGPIDGGQHLTEMRFRRLAVHLRRLFEFVREAAEPIAASFSERGTRGESVHFEVVVAPLASDGRRVDAVFGGIVRRQHTPEQAA
jgi:ribose-phosphate pyrophosphokinase